MIKKRYYFLFFIFLFAFHQSSFGESILNEYLVAKPNMQDPRFTKTVIFMLYHNKQDGAAGLVVNKPIETMTISKLFADSNLTAPNNITEKKITLYWGGPVKSENIFFIHSSDYESNNFIYSNKHYTVTREPKILFDIAKNKGPKEFIILSGIAVWKPGQLDSEMVGGRWKKESNTFISLFKNTDKMWKNIINSQNI